MLQRLAFTATLITFAVILATPTVTLQAAQSTKVAVVYVAADSLPPLFDTESAAQAHCPKDVVVWLNIPSGIYHYQGERWYGRTKHGAYACEKEAIKAGDRASENGQ
jgi:hypothetical protein